MVSYDYDEEYDDIEAMTSVTYEKKSTSISFAQDAIWKMMLGLCDTKVMKVSYDYEKEYDNIEAMISVI